MVRRMSCRGWLWCIAWPSRRTGLALPGAAGLASPRFGSCGVLDEVGDCLACAGAELEQGAELRAGDAGVADQGQQFDLFTACSSS